MLVNIASQSGESKHGNLMWLAMREPQRPAGLRVPWGFDAAALVPEALMLGVQLSFLLPPGPELPISFHKLASCAHVNRAPRTFLEFTGAAFKPHGQSRQGTDVW